MAAGLAAPALANNVRELRLVSTWPLQLDGLGDGVLRVAKTITDLSGGRLKVTVYGPGQLVGPFDVHDAVGAGDADLYHSAEYFFQGKSRAFNFFTTIPMGLSMIEHATWIAKGGGQALWDELAAGYGIKPLACGGTGPQSGGWFKEEVKSVEDFRNIVMRIPGLGGVVVERFGAKAILLPPNKIVGAFRDGQINAMEWVGPWNDLHFGFQKLMQTFLFPGFHEPGSMTSLGLNLELWNDLDPQDRAVITAVAESETLLLTSSFHANNSFSLRRLATEYGTTPSEMPTDVFEGLAEVAEQVVAEVANDDDLSRRVYESYADFRGTVAGGAAARELAAFIRQRSQSSNVL
ncbi:MAG: TRAP transporter substrate-binding protein [Pseudomonadota bacterium]